MSSNSALHIDAFNGDADGICSLIQLRKANPVQLSEQLLVTGVKRDINLIEKIAHKQALGAKLTVLDVSFDRNQAALKPLLSQLSEVLYVDHHRADTLFEHQNLNAVINTAPNVCTAMLVNKLVHEAHPLWAVAAAFGDGMDQSAEALARAHHVSVADLERLKRFGQSINYNGYGETLDDLNVAPAELYRQLIQWRDPLECMNEQPDLIESLWASMHEDQKNAEQSKVVKSSNQVHAVLLGNHKWSRRIGGTFGNTLAKNNPSKAVVVATQISDTEVAISLRAPKQNPVGASDLCLKYGGGGRAAAAGVDRLSLEDLPGFIDQACRLSELVS